LPNQEKDTRDEIGKIENTITDFILFLKTERFKFQTIFKTREEAGAFDELVRRLGILMHLILLMKRLITALL
jgi:hypothetical protein